MVKLHTDMTDSDFLKWLVERLIYVYKENTNTDFVIRLRDLAWSLDEPNYINRSDENERHPRDEGTHTAGPDNVEQEN